MVEEKAKGTIVISLWKNKPFTCEFDGNIVGEDINIAWRSLYREYKKWKHSLSKTKKLEVSNG